MASKLGLLSREKKKKKKAYEYQIELFPVLRVLFQHENTLYGVLEPGSSVLFQYMKSKTAAFSDHLITLQELKKPIINWINFFFFFLIRNKSFIRLVSNYKHEGTKCSKKLLQLSAPIKAPQPKS